MSLRFSSVDSVDTFQPYALEGCTAVLLPKQFRCDFCCITCHLQWGTLPLCLIRFVLWKCGVQIIFSGQSTNCSLFYSFRKDFIASILKHYCRFKPCRTNWIQQTSKCERTLCQVKKCTYDCCLSGQKLCGESCCTAPDLANWNFAVIRSWFYATSCRGCRRQRVGVT
jgi:hypothetical protein